MYLDLNTRFYLVALAVLPPRLPERRLPRHPPRARRLRLILVAHYDAARSGYVFGERGLPSGRRLSERGRLLLGPFRLVFWGGLAPLLPILGARMAGFDAAWLAVLQLVPTVLLIVAAFLLIDIALSEIVPGAYDNASGVAAVLSAAERAAGRAAREPRRLGGADRRRGVAWARACAPSLRAHRKQLDPERTFFVNVDSVSYGTVHYEVSEGAVVSLPHGRRAGRALRGAGRQPVTASPPATPLTRCSTTRSPPRIRRHARDHDPGLADGGCPAPWYHTHEDTPERVDAAALTRATEFVVALARLLDRDAGRRIAPARLPRR